MDSSMSGVAGLVSAAFLLLGAAGFSMMNIGLSRAHASATLCLTSLGAFAFSIIAYHFVGQIFMPYPGSEYFPLAMAVFSSSIILGAMAERIKIWPCLLFAGFFSAFVFPVLGGWAWNGWLADLNFHDIAGASVIHVTAGCAALTGSLIMGPRAGRYAKDGRPIPFGGSNIPLATLGAFLVCVGWVGMTTGQGLYDSSSAFTNILLGGGGGVIGAILFTTWRYNKPDTTIIINSLIAGMVSVSAGADIFWPIFAVFLGGAGGILCAYVIPLMDRYKLDDPVGVIPVHLGGGILGTIAVVFTGHIIGQLIGLLVILVIAGGASAAIWIGIRRTVGLRCSSRAERHGLDMEAVGLEAYPDFPIRTAGRPDITQIDLY
jgi:Amt family ammonium transporter